jgi:hypothetical protein
MDARPLTGAGDAPNVHIAAGYDFKNLPARRQAGSHLTPEQALFRPRRTRPGLLHEAGARTKTAASAARTLDVNLGNRQGQRFSALHSVTVPTITAI